MSFAPEHVLAEAAAWAWVPEEARTVDTDEFLLIAYPPHFADPTVALRWSSERRADDVIDDVLSSARRHTGVYRGLLDHRLRAGREAGCRMALVKGRVETSAPVLLKAGFRQYGEVRACRLGRG